MLIEGDRMADVSRVRKSQHARKGGSTTIPHKCSVGERLYSQVHVCNHARCAANDPGYNVKSALPPKKFLVAKKHAYGGIEEKGEKKRTNSGSSTTSPDHQPQRSHALTSLTNSVLTTESGSSGKARSNGLRSKVLSVVQSRRATMDNRGVRSATKVRPTATHSSSSVRSGSSTGRSTVTATESHSTAQKSRLSSAGSMPSPPATEQSKELEDSTSPESSITSIRFTQITSSRRKEQFKEAEDDTQGLVAATAAASSPTASVGSNHDTEFPNSKEIAIFVEKVGIVEQPASNFGDFQIPSSSSCTLVPENSASTEAPCDSPSPSSPSVDSRAPVSESLTPSTPSTSFASAAPERSRLTTTPASELSSSTLLKTAVGQEEISYDSSGPSVDSRPTTSGSLTSSATSQKSGSRDSSKSIVRSSRRKTPPSSTPPSSTDKFARNLKESSKPPLSSSSRASGNRPSRDSVSPAPGDSSPAPTNASRLAKRFVTDLQARSAARRSTKGVRSIELRGGKAQSYSTTTVTSWNVTTTTVETSVSISEITTEEDVESGLAGSGSVELSVKPEQFSKKESRTAAAGPNASAVDPKAITEAPTTLKFAKNASSFEEVHTVEPESVALKHGEVAERRLSEEYMTNHALEGVVRKISDNDHRVKVLVHAFETLATLTDSEALAIEQLAHESLSATTIAA